MYLQNIVCVAPTNKQGENIITSLSRVIINHLNVSYININTLVRNIAMKGTSCTEMQFNTCKSIWTFKNLSMDDAVKNGSV